MNVKVVETKRYDCDLNIVDVDVISEEDRLSLKGIEQIDLKLYYIYRVNERCKTLNMPFNIGALLTFSSSELPVGTEFYLHDNNLINDYTNSWYVFTKDKAFGIARFDPNEYTDDEVKLKSMLREWAKNIGIKFGE